MKNTFAAKTFAAHHFASGHFTGVGVELGGQDQFFTTAKITRLVEFSLNACLSFEDTVAITRTLEIEVER